MKRPLNVFFATSEEYLPHFTAAVTSLLVNNKKLALNLFVIHDALNTVIIQKAKKFFIDVYQNDLTFIDISHIDFSSFKFKAKYPKYTYFRLFLADLAPGNIDTALFLDSDLIITGSLEQLAEIDMSDKFICAASEASVDDNVRRLNNIGCPAESYFNAGVLLINLTLWRKQKFSEAFLEVAEKYAGHLDWVDQDILNIYFANRWTKIHRKFNAVHLIRPLSALPTIIHYASASKPWQYLDTHPYNSLYWKYLRLTPYRNNKPQDFTVRNFIVKNGRLIKRSLREAGLLAYKPYPVQE